jgi:hypothetical protein
VLAELSAIYVGCAFGDCELGVGCRRTYSWIFLRSALGISLEACQLDLRLRMKVSYILAVLEEYAGEDRMVMSLRESLAVLIFGSDVGGPSACLALI